MYGLDYARQETKEERDGVINLEAALCGREWAFYSQVQVDAEERVEEERDDEESLEGGETDFEQ